MVCEKEEKSGMGLQIPSRLETNGINMNDSDFAKYYFKFKELVELHKTMKLGKNPHIPSVFSERLVKKLCGYQDWSNRDFDAKTEDGLAVEIKATGTKSGTTSINLKKIQTAGENFSHIAWAVLDFKLDQLHIKIITKDKISNRLSGVLKDRENITLSHYSPEDFMSYNFSLNLQPNPNEQQKI